MTAAPFDRESNPLRNCPKCGTELSHAVLSGQCPVCLVKVIRDSATAADVPFPPPAVSRSISLAPGAFRYFGDYELREEIGRGGMGVVFKARQLSLNRTVAVKLIAPEQLDSPRAVERFHTEAAAAANLDHPNIVPIYETGECEGRHYFSMKLVEGQSLAQQLLKTDHPAPKPSAGGPGRTKAESASSIQSARLVAKVATAVHYAHQRGILHRDLKPGNILLDASGEPHVADFGLAKNVQLASSLTVSGELLGTPAYMAPEQAAGKAAEMTTASDVYSLGVILYELLTGQPPFRAATALETLHAVLHHEPAAPRSSAPGIPRDMETICLKCLEKEPARRYASALELADELDRFLRGEPIRARAASTPEKVWRWCRRKPALAVALALLVLTFFSGIGGILWQWSRAEQHAASAKTEATTNYEIATFFEEMLDAVGPSVAMGRDTTMLREILDRTVTYLGEDLKNQPAVESELRRIIGKVYLDLGEYAMAEEMHRKALAMDRKLHGNEHPNVVISLANLGSDLRIQGKLDEAEAMHREALALGRKVLGHEHYDVATSLNNLGCALQDQGKLDEAGALHREALEMQRRLLGVESPEAATTLINLANVLDKQNDLAGAEKLYRESLEMQRKMSGDDHPRVALALANLANTLGKQGNFTEAEGIGREALALYKKLFGNESVDVARTMNSLAGAIHNQHRHEEAETLLREALAMQRKLLGNEHKNTANTLTGLATILSSQGKRADAEPFLREILAINRKTLNNDDPSLAGAIANLAVNLAGQQKHDEAEPLFREAVAVVRKVQGNEHPDTASWLSRLALVLEKQSKLTDAETMHREAIAVSRKVRGGEHLEQSILLSRLGLLLDKRGDLAAAEPVYQEAVEVARKTGSSYPPAVHDRVYELAQNLYRQNKFADAEPLYREVIEGRKPYLGAKHDDVLVPTAVLAGLLADWAWTERGSLADVSNLKPEILARAREAEQLLRECLAIRLRGPNPNDIRTAGVRTRLGGALIAVALTDPALNNEAREVTFTEAEPLLLEGNEALQQSREAHIRFKRDAIVRLVRFYEAWEKQDKAAEWQWKLNELDKATAKPATGETNDSPRPDNK